MVDLMMHARARHLHVVVEIHQPRMKTVRVELFQEFLLSLLSPCEPLIVVGSRFERLDWNRWTIGQPASGLPSQSRQCVRDCTTLGKINI